MIAPAKIRPEVAVRIGACAVLLACLALVTPPADPSIRLCGFHWLTGRQCGLCGLTRAVFALGKGHCREAMRLNALSPLGLAMLFGLFWNGPLVGRLWSFGMVAFGVYGVFRIFY